MKKLITALMLTVLASSGALITENQSLAATRGASRARHSMTSAKGSKAKKSRTRKSHGKKSGVKKKTRTKKGASKGKRRGVNSRRAKGQSQGSVGKIVRARKSHGRKAGAVTPVVGENGGNIPAQISQ